MGRSLEQVRKLPRALLVDDAPARAERLSRILRAAGCETLVTRSALDALRSIDGVRVDLVVMDAEIEVAYQEFSDRLHARAQAPVVYVCPSSGAAGFHTLSRGIGFLVPPFDPKYADALIRRALRGPGNMV